MEFLEGSASSSPPLRQYDPHAMFRERALNVLSYAQLGVGVGSVLAFAGAMLRLPYDVVQVAACVGGAIAVAVKLAHERR